MYEFLFLFALILPIAWYFGYRQGMRKSKQQASRNSFVLPGKYFKGLNYLLNEESDKAIDTFISILEVDSDTVETHLALGNLFRRRGEVNRAIRIHQNLIARPALNDAHKKLSFIELGYDYMAAGLLDRAENIFKDLSSSSEHQNDSLKQLLVIYQQTKDWQNAINVSLKLKQTSDEQWSNQIAHFYCELAEKNIAENQPKEAIAQLKKAFDVHPHHLRATLLMGEIYYSLRDFKRAQKYYRELLRRNVVFLAEALDKINDTFVQLKDYPAFYTFLQSAVEKGAGSSVMLRYATEIQKQQGDRAAAEYIAAQMHSNPSIKGLLKLIELHLKHASENAKPSLQMLFDIVARLLEDKPVYRCENCGFDSKILFWQCPSCKHWGSVKPIVGIEGE